MKEIAQKKDKGVSRIAANVIMIVIGIVIGATMVTMVGSITHAPNKDAISMNATTQEIESPSGEYNVYLNVTFSSIALDTGHVVILINGTNDGIFSTFLNDTSSKASDLSQNPVRIGNGSDFRFNEMQKVMSLELLFEGNVIFNTGSISIIYRGSGNSIVTVGASTSEVTSASGFTVYVNVSSSSSSFTTSSLTVTINGATQGSFSSFLSGHRVNLTGGSNPTYSNPTTLTGGSNFEFNNTVQVTSFELIYKGNVILNSGTITLS